MELASRQELKDLTGRRRPSAVAEHLRVLGVRYVLGADGWPRVSQAELVGERSPLFIGPPRFDWQAYAEQRAAATKREQAEWTARRSLVTLRSGPPEMVVEKPRGTFLPVPPALHWQADAIEREEGETESAFRARRREFWGRKRYGRKKDATPGWADIAEIKAIYTEANRLSRETRTKHEVDHIVPIQHPLVCGLHVPWNLQIVPSTDNRRKCNKFEP